MRISKIRKTVSYAAVAAVLAFSQNAATHAQNPDQMMPDAGTAKAKAILQQAIEGLGGAAFLNAHDSDCTARIAAFEHSGESSGTVEVRIQRQYPDKTRIEYHGNNYITDIFLFEVHGKGMITTVYTPEAAWTIGRDGTTDQPADAVANYKEQLQTDAYTIMRTRLNDALLYFRYGGTDIVDLKMADWVEIGDRDGHTIRIAIDQKNHLPLRTVVLKRDPETREPTDRTTIYSNYHLVDGVQTPWQVTRMQNGWLAQQTFYEACQYDSNLPDALFIRGALDGRSGQGGEKKICSPKN